MDTTQEKPIQPFQPHPNLNFGITPFGIYCFECNLPIGNIGSSGIIGTFRKHINRKKHHISSDQCISDLVSSLENAIKYRYGNIRNYDKWFEMKNTAVWRCSCGLITKSHFNLTRHIESRQEDGHIGKKGLGHFTTCKRTIENNTILEMMNKPVNIVSVDTTSTSSVTLSTITSSSDRNIPLHNYCVPVKSTNNKWLTTTLEDVRKVFDKYKRLDEVLDPYLPLLKLLIIWCEGNVIKQIERDLALMENNNGVVVVPVENNKDDYGKENESVLDFFIECICQWVKGYCREHVNILDGNIRRQLHSYFEESMTSVTGYNMNFNMREKEDVICRELKTIVCMVWKLHNNGEINQALESLLSPIIKDVHDIHKKHLGSVSRQAVEELIYKLVIQKFLYFTYIESKANAYSLLLGHRLVMTRLFFLKKKRSASGSTERELSMRSCGEFGSIVSLHIHIYRLGIASLIACTEGISWKYIMENVTKSSLCHALSPIINKVKQMNNNKVEVRSKSIKDNGDISVQDFNFPRSIWSRMIGSLIESFNNTLSEIIVMDQWKDIVDLKNQIIVEKMTNEKNELKHNLMHYKFYVNLNGKIIDQSVITFKKEIPLTTFERLTGLVMISLHGLGLGSTRITELFRIMQHQVSWSNGSFYYITSSNKRRSSNISTKKVITHKLPASVSRYLLIYDYIGMEFSKGRNTFLFTGTSVEIGCNYDNQQFFLEFARIFDLSSSCSCLVMRHLYTSICNYLFPANNNNFDKSIVSTVACIAEMSGHSAETHEQFYSSTINKETFFDKYHQSLGEDITIDTTLIDPLDLASQSDVLRCLKVLLGMNANFLSELQRDLLMDSCNNHSKHTICTIGCGGGKSLSWIVPAVRYSLNGMRPKLSIVVIPYGFLLDHHVSSTFSLIGQCSNIVVKKLKGTDIDDNIIPDVLRDKGSLPGLLFLSLEAIGLLVQYHFRHLELLQSEGLLSKIYIDECHTLLSELNFRHHYHQIAKLAALNVPMVVMSGSIHRGLIKNFLNFMFGSMDISSYNVFLDKDLFGSKLLRIEHVAAVDYIEKSCVRVVEYLKEHSDSNVHVIVSTVNEGREVYAKLRLWVGFSCAFIYRGSDGQDVIAKKWKENEIRVLISTTLGLVGNESSKTQLVCIVGLLYNIPSIVQSIGRIRPMRRNNQSLCVIYTGVDNRKRLEMAKKDSKDAHTQLVKCKVLPSDDNKIDAFYFRSMSMTAVNNWLFSDPGCRLARLGWRLGFEIKEECKICDRCANTHVRISSSLKKKQMNNNQRLKDIGVQVLQRLRQTCFCCKSSLCSGTCVVRSLGSSRLVCYHCLGNHRSSRCDYYKPILKGKVCFSCYRYNYSPVCNHDYDTCGKDGEIKERLRALIQYDFLEKKKQRISSSFSSSRYPRQQRQQQQEEEEYCFRKHLAGIYANAESYFTFLCKYKDFTA